MPKGQRKEQYTRPNSMVDKIINKKPTDEIVRMDLTCSNEGKNWRNNTDL
jgi:hypothetical protein